MADAGVGVHLLPGGCAADGGGSGWHARLRGAGAAVRGCAPVQFRRVRDRRPAAGGPRADRADRHAARTAGDDSSPVTPGASRLRSLIHRTYTAPHRESTQAPRIESLVTEVTMEVRGPHRKEHATPPAREHPSPPD